MTRYLLRKQEREQGWQGKPSECLNDSFSPFPEPVVQARSHGGRMTDDRRGAGQGRGGASDCEGGRGNSASAGM